MKTIDDVIAATEAMGFVIEDTGGGCAWLRRGNLVIVGEDANVPDIEDPCSVFELDDAESIKEETVKRYCSIDAALAAIKGAS